MYRKSTLFIVNDLDSALEDIVSSIPKHSIRIIRNEEDGKDEFQLLHTQKAIKEAYLATETTKYVVLMGSSFRVEAQNSLLKVLEEPPKNIIFLLITLSKNSILPTILSRVQVDYRKKQKNLNALDINIKQMDLKDIYTFLKQHQRIQKIEAKQLVEALLVTLHKSNIQLTKKELDSFSTSMKLLELNSRPINVISSLLLNIALKR